MTESNVVIYVKDNESVDKALKRFKKKVEKIGIPKKLRGRMYYKKPSEERREKRLKATYRQKMVSQQLY